MNNFWQKFEKPILALAPMVGVSDSAFRQLAKRWGADAVYSEMISADALVHGAEKAHSMMDHVENEQPLVVQIMGNKPEVLAEAAKMAEARGVSGIDINFGCPARKIARNFSGVMLMRDLDRCRRLIEATINAVSLPVSIKVRTSIRTDSSTPLKGRITILDMLERIKDLPIASLMIHGRSFEDTFDGAIDYKMIAEVKKRFTNGPVLANGGVTTIESAQNLLIQTGADGIGLARSVIGRPWIFKQIRDYLQTGTYDELAWEVVKDTVLQHVDLHESHRGSIPFIEIRRHLTHYIKGHIHASEIRQKLVQVTSPQEVSSVLNSY